MNGALNLRPRGVWLVTSLEMRQRIRSKRWYVALGVWTVILAALGALILGAVALWTTAFEDVRSASSVVFSLLMILVLFAMLLVLPALSAGSINGDRSAGTLATLQATLLSPLEIATGKLIAGWLTGLAFLALSLPAILPTALLGGISPFYLLRELVLVALLALFITAIGLGLSAITNRQLGSVVLTYVLVLSVTVVLPVVWFSSAAFLVQKDVTVTQYHADYRPVDGHSQEPQCVKEEAQVDVVRMDLSQPLIWANPVVLLADVAPALPADYWEYDPEKQGSKERPDVLRFMQTGIRYVTHPTHPSMFNSCSTSMPGYPAHLGEPRHLPVWPMGLGSWFLAGAAAFALATWRLTVPMKHLGKGTRIA